MKKTRMNAKRLILEVFFTLNLAAFCSAATFTVTNTNDSGAGSLRDLLAGSSSGDIINFVNTLAGSTISLSSTITISNPVTINGPTGQINLTTNFNSRILSISTGVTAQITNINFVNGQSSSGAAIINNGELILQHCNFTGNNTVQTNSTHGGGALYNNTSAIMFIDNCNFENNKTETPVTGVTFANGGAIYNRGDNCVITNCYFGNNLSDAVMPGITARGGAILSSKPITISNCTFYSNTTSSQGSIAGAIYLSGGSTNVSDISFCTFSNNSSTTAKCIYNLDQTLTIQSNIFDQTVFSSPLEVNMTSNGGNVFPQGGSLSFAISSDQFANPLLSSPDYNNGAFTKTMALDCTSPAINTGIGTSAPSTDQAGQTRIIDGIIDAGAYEFQGFYNVVASSSQTTICQGDQITLTASIPTSATFSWDNGLGNGQTHIASPMGTTNYIVTATYASCVDKDTITIIVNAKPNLVATSSVPSICEGENATLNGSMSESGSYDWDNSLGLGQSHVVSPVTPTTYTVIATTTDGCKDTATVFLDVNPVPTPTINNNAGVLTVNTGYTSYQWYLDGNPISGATSNTYTATSPGDYSCLVTNASGCEAYTSIIVIPLGINENTSEILNLYPNPAINNLTVEINSKTKYSIINSIGEIVLTGQLNPGINTITIDHLSDGTYLLLTENYDKLKFMVRK